METNKATICSKCLEKINGERICPRCGNDNSVDNDAKYLKVFTMLQDKYIIGKTISENGESAVYIGFDAETKRKVFVKEYAPSAICRRSSDGVLGVTSGFEAQYKALMSDFYDLHKKLALMKNDILLPIHEIIGENNTVYVIYEYGKYITLESYINSAGGDLSSDETVRMFEAFLKSLSAIHSEGISHCGISPQTVVVDKQCRLYLTAFETHAERTLKSDIDAQLFDGFSAPEQYSLKSWLGTWTDVYSSAALIYYCMTSVHPPRAIDRHKRDTMVPCHNINTDANRSVSVAIQKAMHLRTEDRTQTIDGFLNALNGESAKASLVKIPAVKLRKTSSDIKIENTSNDSPKRFPYALVSAVITVVVLCFFGTFLFKSIFGTQLEQFIDKHFSTNSATIHREDMTGNVPNFVGKTLVDVKSVKENRELFTFTQTYEYNDTVKEGVIISQNPDSSALIADTFEIELVISQGSLYTTVPNIVSMDMAQAMTALNEAGITNYKFFQVEEAGYFSGEVIACLPAPGMRFNRETGYLEVVCQK